MESSLVVVALRSVQINLSFERGGNPSLCVISSASIWVLIKKSMYLKGVFPMLAVGSGLEP